MTKITTPRHACITSVAAAFKNAAARRRPITINGLAKAIAQNAATARPADFRTASGPASNANNSGITTAINTIDVSRNANTIT